MRSEIAANPKLPGARRANVSDIYQARLGICLIEAVLTFETDQPVVIVSPHLKRGADLPKGRCFRACDELAAERICGEHSAISGSNAAGVDGRIGRAS